MAGIEKEGSGREKRSGVARTLVDQPWSHCTQVTFCPHANFIVSRHVLVYSPGHRGPMIGFLQIMAAMAGYESTT